MSFRFFCSLTWAYSFMILLHIGENQPSSTAQLHHSDTIDIITYGVSVFRTIMKHEDKNGTLIASLRKIRIENPRIQQLMVQNISTVLDMYSCERVGGLDFCESVFRFFDEEYEAFVNYSLHKNDQRNPHEFPTDFTSMHNSGVLEAYIETGLQWIDITKTNPSLELFGALVDHYDPMVRRSCNDFPSLNQYLYLLYNKLLLELIKLYSIIIYSHVEPSILTDNKNYTIHLGDVIDDFQSEVAKLSDNALKAMNRKSSTYIAQGDPSSHTKGITYESLDYFIQDYVTGMVFLSQDHKCTSTCSSYNDTVHYNHTQERYFSGKYVCTGRIRSCTDSPVERVYVAAPDSTRRYDGLSNIPSSGKKLEFWGRQPEYNGMLSIALYSNMCEICSCICDMIDSPNSIRYVDLRIQRSKSYAAFVITGVRFRIINRVLYLQIQEGMLQNGKIIPETVSWTKIVNTDRDHDHDDSLFKLDYDNRSFNLHDVTLPDDYATTMIAFTVINGIVGLYTQGLHMMNGELNVSSLKKLSGQSLEEFSSREVFQPDGFNIPTMENMKNNKISEPNKYFVKFETSDWRNDAGQNVVPFIDLQDVVTNPPAPISGIGMHVRYGGTSGGFLAPKLLSVNDGMKIILEDMRERIASLRPDVETAVKNTNALIHKTTPMPPEVSTTSRPKPEPLTTRRPVPHFFIGNRG